jgi:serine/threonine protein kinase
MANSFLPEHPPIPGYEPVRILGRCTIKVYVARQLGSGQLVVLKVYRQGFPEEIRKQEVLLARFHHPNILRVYEIGEVQGWFYCALEYVEKTLADRLAKGPLRDTEGARLARAVALALQYAREHGMISLNLKPNSILLTEENVPKLFDLYSIDDVSSWPASRRIGLSEFTAPEEFTEEEFRGATPATDVYRVGAVMYAMLTGQPPFARGGQLVELVQRVVEQPPVPLRRMNASVTRKLEAVCMKCLEKRPEKRYASPQDLADELGRFV